MRMKRVEKVMQSVSSEMRSAGVLVSLGTFSTELLSSA
jgi:hypothetical protein